MSKKKDLISQSALQAFAQYGYSDTTMDNIAEVANVAKGTLYYHFKTKEELFFYVNQKGVEMLIESVTTAMNDTSHTVYERMLYVLDEHLRFFAEHEEFCLLLLSFSSGDHSRDEMVRQLLSSYFITMETYFDSMQKQGVIAPELEIRTLTSSLFGMIGFTVLRKLYRREEIYTEQTRNTLLAMCKGALGIGSANIITECNMEKEKRDNE
ncbi:TetR/AcrR family transcriptional regulator [Brevibacillus dissolubilis]|uniref:TetR/AcrR family transcriptional regulator n=1 Tax=Brevibacillus dissolubilis TaxID=1844116 RepID=UPI00111756E3|nr:TetR/AcrR family transcriptional regulator [Brevibacillus dissolubilis]